MTEPKNESPLKVEKRSKVRVVMHKPGCHAFVDGQCDKHCADTPRDVAERLLSYVGDALGGYAMFDVDAVHTVAAEVLRLSVAPDDEHINELVYAIHSELAPTYHVTPGGLKWSKSTNALLELVTLVRER